MNAISDKSALGASTLPRGDAAGLPIAAYPEPDDRRFVFGWWLLPASVVGGLLWVLLYLTVRALLP